VNALGRFIKKKEEARRKLFVNGSNMAGSLIRLGVALERLFEKERFDVRVLVNVEHDLMTMRNEIDGLIAEVRSYQEMT